MVPRLETPLVLDVFLAQPFLMGMMFGFVIPAYALAVASLLAKKQRSARISGYIGLAHGVGLLGAALIARSLVLQGAAPFLAMGRRPSLAPSRSPAEIAEGMLTFGLAVAVGPLVISTLGILLAGRKPER